jgi:shikimate dehydrogenase
MSRRPLTGGMMVAGVLGSPVRHSLSPLIHNAWLDAAGIDGVYIALEVDEPGFANFIDGLRGASLRGLNVTLPYKEVALKAAHNAHPRARRAQAANLLTFSDGEIWADNTDGLGLLTAFAEQAPGFDAASGPVAIVGAGGAARGAVGALLDAGCTDIRIINRTIGRAEALASELGGHAFELQDAEAAFGDVSAVINATSAGLDGAGALHVPLSATPETAVIMDMVYKPIETPFLRRARSLNRRTVDGLAMLIGQAAPSFEAFYGQPPPAGVQVRALALKALEP